MRKKTEALEAASKKHKEKKSAEPVRTGVGKYLKAPPVKNSAAEPAPAVDQVPKKKSKLVSSGGLSDFSSW